MARLYWQCRGGKPQLLRQYLLISRRREHVGGVETRRQLYQWPADAGRTAHQVQATRGTYQDGESQHLLLTEGVHIPVEVGARCLRHATPLSAVWYLVE